MRVSVRWWAPRETAWFVGVYRLRVVSLFCGCGGLDLGFKEHGFDLVYACDNDRVAVDVYARNVDPRVYARDVTTEQFHADIRSMGTADVVLGGFPCQGFSKAGPKVRDDPRNVLYLEMKRAVAQLQPVVFIGENVDGLSQNFGGQYIKQIVGDFAGIGYAVEWRILEAACYGLPQYRRRIVFVGIRRNCPVTFEWPEPTHSLVARNGEFTIEGQHQQPDNLWSQLAQNSAPLARACTIRDAIADIVELSSSVPDHKVTNGWPDQYHTIFRAIREGQKLCNVRHSDTSVYTWNIPEVFGATTDRERLVLETISKNRRHKRYGDIPNGNPLAVDVIEALSGLKAIRPEIESLLEKRYLKEKDGKYDLLGAMFCSGLFKRPRWDEPSPTVLTVFDNPRYFIHPLRDRPFTVRECARLQGFPDDFIFTSDDRVASLRDAYRLIGNAVPPPLASKLAGAVKRAMLPLVPAAMGLAGTKGSPYGLSYRRNDEVA